MLWSTQRWHQSHELLAHGLRSARACLRAQRVYLVSVCSSAGVCYELWRGFAMDTSQRLSADTVCCM